MFDDFKLRFICKYDPTFWLHMAREFVIFQIMFWLVFGLMLLHMGAVTGALVLAASALAAAFCIGINLAWEWQDGLRNDGFNVLDFIAGLIGIGAGIMGVVYLFFVENK